MMQNRQIAAARAFLYPVNRAIIAAASGRRQGHAASLSHRPVARAGGARAPLSLAARPVVLQVITERVAAGEMRVTPLDTKTAVRAMPPLLAGLDRADPRRRAAEALADAFERIGAARGVDWQGGNTSGGISDGGATTRVKHAARLRMIEAAANGWPVDPRHGSVARGAVRLALPVQRVRGDRLEIRCFNALVALCVEGCTLAQILAAYGWSDHSKHTGALGAALLAALDDIGGALGFGRMGPERGA